ACGSSQSTPHAGGNDGATNAPPPRPPQFATDDAGWGRFHSKRFQLSIPLPDGKTWKIDDHSKPELVATHAPTSSRVTVITTTEEELVNRKHCETRARNLGIVPANELTTVDD